MFEVGKLYTIKPHERGFVEKLIFLKEVNDKSDDSLILLRLSKDEEEELVYSPQVNLMFLEQKIYRNIGNAKKLFYKFLWEDKIVCMKEAYVDCICQIRP